MHELIQFVVLPDELTDFERGYLARMNRVGKWFFIAHLPVFVAVAWFNDTNPLLAAVLTTATLSVPLAVSRVFDHPRTLSHAFGFTSMVMGALLVHFGQGPIQIEMHFYFFVLLALLSVFANPVTILIAAGTVAAHHLLFWALLPRSVFNYDAPVWVVLVHATFVVLESVASVFLARSFFDNVIGLDKIVQKRTQELDQRNGHMRAVLDHVEEGLLTIAEDGSISPEFSLATSRLLGTLVPGESFESYLARVDQSAALSFRLGWDDLLADFMPQEVVLSQLPSRVRLGASNELALRYTPLGSADDFRGLLVVVNDITAEQERVRLAARQNEVGHLYELVSRDRTGVLSFLEESATLVRSLSEVDDIRVQMRALHTLKGNGRLFGLELWSALCHDAETVLSESRAPLPPAELEALRTEWAGIEQLLGRMLGSRDKVEIAAAEYDSFLQNVRARKEHSVILRRAASWRLEATRTRLAHLSEHAQAVAARLGKTHMAVEVRDNGVKTADRLAPLWGCLIHLVRNAVDHGVDAEQERVKLGKEPVARSHSARSAWAFPTRRTRT
jgi:two-component system, chemotaxis family, sensor kinase CheA